MKRYAIGIVGGLSPTAVADLYLKIAHATPQVRQDRDYCDILVTSDLRQEIRGTEIGEGEKFYDVPHRILYVYQVAKLLEAQGANIVVIPDFISHSALDLLQKGIGIPVLDMADALAQMTRENHPELRRVGLLTTTHCLTHNVFGPRFKAHGLDIIVPEAEIQEHVFMKALYGPEGLKRGNRSAQVFQLIGETVQHLLSRGAEAIAFGVTELPLAPRSMLPAACYLDCNEAAARMLLCRATSFEAEKNGSGPRLGVLGGLGPLATVDLLNKIVRNTPASCDQEHLRIVVESDPTIPDRNRALLQGGEDPSIALLQSAQRLEEAGASLIICPCNTAHAFLHVVEKHISTPVLRMPEAVASYLEANYPNARRIGLLATDGAIQSDIYVKPLAAIGRKLLVPERDAQKQVMEAIFGARGIKAGFLGAEPKGLLLSAAEELIRRGAEIIVLACTEIPLVLENGAVAVPLLDATEILAVTAVRMLSKPVSGNP